MPRRAVGAAADSPSSSRSAAPAKRRGPGTPAWRPWLPGSRGDPGGTRQTFGDGEHRPAKARRVRLELLKWDWAAGVEVFGADRVDDDDDDVLRRELELAAERRERGDSREETVEEKALLDDMEEDLLDDVVPDDKEPERQTYWPTGGSIDGETPERWLWRETPERMEVDVKLPRAAPSAKAMKVAFGSQKRNYGVTGG